MRAIRGRVDHRWDGARHGRATGSSTGSFDRQAINQYAGALTNLMTWSVNTNAKTLTCQFTHSTLGNRAPNCSQAISLPAYTVASTLTGTTFTFQGSDFIKK